VGCYKYESRRHNTGVQITIIILCLAPSPSGGNVTGGKAENSNGYFYTLGEYTMSKNNQVLIRTSFIYHGRLIYV